MLPDSLGFMLVQCKVHNPDGCYLKVTHSEDAIIFLQAGR